MPKTHYHSPHGACHEDDEEICTAGVILAVDLGKYKSVACIYPVGGDGAEISFPTFDTNRDQLEKLLRSVKPAALIIEACALSGWVCDLAIGLGVPCSVANTSSEAWKFKHNNRKTDKDDALRQAELAALGQLPVVTIPSKSDREWKASSRNGRPW